MSCLIGGGSCDFQPSFRGGSLRFAPIGTPMTRRSGVNLEVPQRNAGLVAPHSLHIFYVRLSGINACKVISVKIRRRNCQK